jgi:hypothetical protein
MSTHGIELLDEESVRLVAEIINILLSGPMDDSPKEDFVEDVKNIMVVLNRYV